MNINVQLVCLKSHHVICSGEIQANILIPLIRYAVCVQMLILCYVKLFHILNLIIRIFGTYPQVPQAVAVLRELKNENN